MRKEVDATLPVYIRQGIKRNGFCPDSKGVGKHAFGDVRGVRTPLVEWFEKNRYSNTFPYF